MGDDGREEGASAGDLDDVVGVSLWELGFHLCDVCGHMLEDFLSSS